MQYYISVGIRSGGIDYDRHGLRLVTPVGMAHIPDYIDKVSKMMTKGSRVGVLLQIIRLYNIKAETPLAKCFWVNGNRGIFVPLTRRSPRF